MMFCGLPMPPHARNAVGCEPLNSDVDMQPDVTELAASRDSIASFELKELDDVEMERRRTYEGDLSAMQQRAQCVCASFSDGASVNLGVCATLGEVKVRAALRENVFAAQIVLRDEVTLRDLCRTANYFAPPPHKVFVVVRPVPAPSARHQPSASRSLPSESRHSHGSDDHFWIETLMLHAVANNRAVLQRVVRQCLSDAQRCSTLAHRALVRLLMLGKAAGAQWEPLILRGVTCLLTDANACVPEPPGYVCERTALQACCGINAMVACAELLLQRKADPNVATAEEHATPLIGAALQNDMKCAQLLLQYGATANVANALGVTPLSIAQELGHAQMVRLLSAFSSPAPNVARVRSAEDVATLEESQSVQGRVVGATPIKETRRSAAARRRQPSTMHNLVPQTCHDMTKNVPDDKPSFFQGVVSQLVGLRLTSA